jgi:hypothetical protein
MGHRRYGTVRVAYTTDAGERGTVVLTATRRGATLGGVPAAVSRTGRVLTAHRVRSSQPRTAPQ